MPRRATAQLGGAFGKHPTRRDFGGGWCRLVELLVDGLQVFHHGLLGGAFGTRPTRLTWEQSRRWVGHVSPETTKLYTHFNLTASKKRMESLEIRF